MPSWATALLGAVHGVLSPSQTWPTVQGSQRMYFAFPTIFRLPLEMAHAMNGSYPHLIGTAQITSAFVREHINSASAERQQLNTSLSDPTNDDQITTYTNVDD